MRPKVRTSETDVGVDSMRQRSARTASEATKVLPGSIAPPSALMSV